MSTNPNRRGLLRSLFAGLFGWGAAQAAPDEPPRCAHYYDGVLWKRPACGPADSYVRDATGCPFCRAEKSPGATGSADPHVTTLAYDQRSFPQASPMHVTTTTYDAEGRVVSTTGPVAQACTYPYRSSQPPR